MQTNHYEYINGLVKLVQEVDDPKSLAELVNYYDPLIKAAVKKLCFRIPEAKIHQEDLMAEGPLVIRDIVNQYDSELSYFSYFLSTRIDHAMQLIARRKYIGVPGDVSVISIDKLIDTSEKPVHDPFAQILMRHSVREAVESLRKPQRDAIEMYFYLELTQQEAAQLLGITQASFSKRLQRGLKTLSNLLSDWE